MAPDQNLSMLVGVCREAVAEAEEMAESQHRAERMTAPWTAYLPSWQPKMVAILKMFEDVK